MNNLTNRIASKFVNDTVECVGFVPDSDCLSLYTVDPNGALAIMYRRYSGMLHKIGQKYFSFRDKTWIALYGLPWTRP